MAAFDNLRISWRWVIAHEGTVYGQARGFEYETALSMARAVFPDLERDLVLIPWPKATRQQRVTAESEASQIISPKSIRKIEQLQTPDRWAQMLQTRFGRCDKDRGAMA